MLTYILYIIISIAIVWGFHHFFFSLKEEKYKPQGVINIKKENEKRESILAHLKDEEREDKEIEDYLKTQIKKVLNINEE